MALEHIKLELIKQEHIKQEFIKQEHIKQEHIKQELIKQQLIKQRPIKQELSTNKKIAIEYKWGLPVINEQSISQQGSILLFLGNDRQEHTPHNGLRKPEGYIQFNIQQRNNRLHNVPLESKLFILPLRTL